MRAELERYARVEVPRYTSYPTAAQFHDGVGEESYRAWLGGLTREDVASLYVHIPFCNQLCWYCGCHTTIVSSYNRVAAYSAALGREVDSLRAALPPIAGLSRVHFGGGTPTMLNQDDFSGLITSISNSFTILPDAEIAVEIDPRALTFDMAVALGRAGVTRASVGVQDLTATVQERVNRVQPFRVVAKAVDNLRSAGIGSISFDLMYGLPGQTAEDLVKTAEIADYLKPDRVAVFGYAHVPWFKKHQRMIDESELPDALERFRQAEAAAKRLGELGFQQIGFDHYARPDDRLAIAARDKRVRRNFQGYTDDQATVLLGLGASSIGALRQGYVQNAPDVGRYVALAAEGHLPITRGFQISDEDRLRASAIERLLCDLQLDIGALCTDFARAPSALDDAVQALQPLTTDGLVRLDGRRVQVTDDGRRFLRSIAACFDEHYQPQQNKHSLAV